MPFKRFSALLAAPLLVLGGCQTISQLGDHTAATLGLGDDVPKSYTNSAVSEAMRSGIAVADEPLAAQAGAAALASHGSAVDAVATMFFVLSATYPVAGGLGGGGICLVRDAGGQVTEYDFLARAARTGSTYAVPGAVKGFSVMQRQYGALPWQRVVSPGEAYAATGFPISQALEARLVTAQNVVRLDAGLAAEFLDESGQLRPVGSETKNLPLGETLSQIRLNGADGFYAGAVAAAIASYTAAQGGTVGTDDLAATTVQQGAARSRGTGSFVTWLPGARTGAGAFSASLLSNLSSQLAATRDPGIATAAAARASLAAFGVGGLPRDLGSTGFAAVDDAGQAASCAVTLNGPFGAGRTVAGAGVQLAATPSGPGGLANAFLTPVIATSSGNGILAGAGSGGPNGSVAALYAVLEAAGGRQLGKRGDLRGTGAAPYDTVNMISCDSEACVALSDPGAHGAGTTAEATVR